MVKILTASGTEVANYSYNAWGKLLSSSGTMASVNPIRYRGYYFDAETGFYCLVSRYYDPQICRFVNADRFASTGQGLLGTNMFAYCGNDPVNKYDPVGGSPVVAVLLLCASLALLLSSDMNSAGIEEKKAHQKYNNETMTFTENQTLDTPGKVNVTFYPKEKLIHIEDSYNIHNKYEKDAIISEIMKSELYSSDTYSDSVDQMLIEWSAHNFVYRMASNYKLMNRFFMDIGYKTPIESTRGVDFRFSLAPSVEGIYKIVTLWGFLQW